MNIHKTEAVILQEGIEATRKYKYKQLDEMLKNDDKEPLVFEIIHPHNSLVFFFNELRDYILRGHKEVLETELIECKQQIESTYLTMLFEREFRNALQVELAAKEEEMRATINVTEWMKKNMQKVNLDESEKEVSAYLSMAMTKLYRLGETSKRFNWSEDFKDGLRAIGPALLHMAGIEDIGKEG